MAGGAGRAWLATALAAIDHRGPNGNGRLDAPGVALGHTQLAMGDLSEAANQPMRSAGGDHWLTQSGEIYSFDQRFARLHSHLPGHGGLGTTSATEVVLEALALPGEPQRWRGGRSALRRVAAALPFGDKLGADRGGKTILKRIARGRVPPWVIDRPSKRLRAAPA